MRFLILLSCAGLFAVPVRAQEGPSAPIFFRTPDLETKREIEKLLSHNGIGSGTREARTKSRAHLRRIGVWTVPFLSGTLAGRKRVKDPRVQMNALLTLGRILDPHCLDAVRTVARTDRGKKVVSVRKSACLVLGLFADPDGENAKTLVEVLDERKARQPYHRAAALALGRIDHKDAASYLVGQVKTWIMEGLPAKTDAYFASALLLAATVRSKDAAPVEFLRDNEELVRRTAATCLLIRPLGTSDRRLVADRLRNMKKDRKVRPLLYHALARIPAETRGDLLRCATRTDEREEARVAALIGLASEWNVRENYKPLKRALPRGRNDAVAAAMLFAIAQSGHEDSVDELIRVMKGGSRHSRFYAAGSLLYLITLSNPTVRHPEELKVRAAIADLRSSPDAALREFDAMRGSLSTNPAKNAELARKWFATMRDPYGLHLWDWTPEDRAWALVNRLIPAIFDLDDIADKSDALQDPAKVGNNPLPGGNPKSGGRELSATPEEQDLLDFLWEKPYYAPEDLGER